jgi:hypothetical protein
MIIKFPQDSDLHYFWKQAYLAALRAGKNRYDAIDAADFAVTALSERFL